MKIFAKIAAVALVAAFVVVGAAGAKAATVAELQAMIAQLQAQLSALSGSTAPAATTFTRDLTVGSTGADVTALQNFLASKGLLTATARGYFGPLTKAAVAAYQTSKGIAPAAGYFGPKTRASVEMDMGSTGSTTGSTSGSTTLSGGDGDFKDFDVLGNPNNEDIEEGQESEVLAFEFDADDSDLKIERVDVLFTEEASSTKPWKVLEKVILSVDGKEVADIDASDEDNWDEQSQDDIYKVRFEDLSSVVKEGDTAKVVVSVEAQDDLDADELKDWQVALGDDAVRAVNAKGIDVYEGSGAIDNDSDLSDETDSRMFTLEEVNAGDLTITVDDDANEADEVEVSEDSETEGVELYIAEVESQEGTNKIEEVTVDLATTTGSVAGLEDMITTLYLFIDGKEVGKESVDGVGTDSVVFDDLSVSIEEDEEVDLVVKADIDEQGDNEDNYSNGDGVYVDGITIDFVDSNDDDQSEPSTSNGGNITFSVDALSVDVVSTSGAESPVAGDESKGRFYVQFKVTAPEEEDIYIAKGATTSTAVGSGKGAEFIVVDGNGTTVTATTTDSNNLLTRVSGGSETGSYYKVSKGTTVTFKLDVIVENTGHSAARTLGVQLTGVNYKVGSAATADTQYTSGLDEDFRSETEYLLTSNTQN